MLGSIKARGLRQLGRVDLALDGRSLVLIGPNGSGKSTLLEELAKELVAEIGGKPHPAASIEAKGGSDRDLRMAYLGRPVRTSWNGDPAKSYRDAHLLALVLDEARSGVEAKGELDSAPKAPDARIARQLEGVLIERWGWSQATNDPAQKQTLEAQLVAVQQTLRTIVGVPGLELAITDDRVACDLGDGRQPTLVELSRGHRAAVELWAEVFLRVEAARRKTGDPVYDPSGVVIVDQLERNLDARLQRELLPMLQRLNPYVQWIVSTHSPLVALSLEDGLVYDTRADEVRRTDSLRKEGLERLVAAMIGMKPGPARASRPPPPPIPPQARIPRQRRQTKGGPGSWPGKKD